MPKEDESSAITKRLDALLRLALDNQRRSEGVNIGDQILILEDCGLSPADAGHILGIESNQIPSYLRRAEDKRLLEKVAKKRRAE